MSESIKSFFLSMLFVPRIGRGAIKVLTHNYVLFKQNIYVNVFWISVEPMVYLFAYGYGINFLVRDVFGISYFKFFFPALVCISSMMVSSYESMHGTFSRAYLEKSYASMFLAPIDSMDLFVGEILWSTFKGIISATILLFSLVVTQQISFHEIMIIFSVCLVTSWLFSALGLLVTSFVKNSEQFIYYQVGFLLPMFLLFGTYVPTQNFSLVFQAFLKLLPLTHIIYVLRSFLSDTFTVNFYLSCVYLLGLIIIITNLALSRMQKKLETFL